MILSDRDIRKALDEKRIIVEPMLPNSIQPASIDLHLGRVFLIFDTFKHEVIDVKKPIGDLMKRVEIEDNEPFILHPSEFALGVTLERTTFGPDIAGRLEGKSSLGRIGLLIHATAGYIDPGNSLHPTLELHNVSPLPIKLYYKMPIAQMSYIPMSSAVERPYGSSKKNKYYGSSEPQASRIDEYFKNGSAGLTTGNH